MAVARFLAHYLNGPLPYVRQHITGNKNVLIALLNTTFPSFLLLIGIVMLVVVIPITVIAIAMMGMLVVMPVRVMMTVVKYWL